MSRENKITCDQCGSDITYTNNAVDYRIEVKNVRIPINPEVTTVTAIMKYREMEKDFDFCSQACLVKTLQNNK